MSNMKNLGLALTCIVNRMTGFISLPVVIVAVDIPLRGARYPKCVSEPLHLFGSGEPVREGVVSEDRHDKVEVVVCIGQRHTYDRKELVPGGPIPLFGLEVGEHLLEHAS